MTLQASTLWLLIHIHASGEEVTISYHPTMFRPREMRQKFLEPWAFECICERCRLEAKLPSGVKQAMQQVIEEADKPDHHQAMRSVNTCN